MGQAIVDFVNNSIEFSKTRRRHLYVFVDKLTGARDAVLGFTDDVAEFLRDFTTPSSVTHRCRI